MKLHNTLSRKTDEFKPLTDSEVSLYTCGPTVYDRVHIGNFRTFIFDDLLRRVIKNKGLKLQHVMNITDVDDKTINRSQEKYPEDKPKTALKKITEHYEKAFLDDAVKLGIDFTDTKIVRATEHIKQMQDLIIKIPNKYTGDDGVYYNLAEDNNYGLLVNLDRAHEHHRINNDEYDKEHVADFALWKKQEGNEPAWDFEIDGQNIAGRPGWHIECSAMSVEYLGQPIDIHTGGVDLIFPHHENEIAQNRAASKKPLANYFVHGEHLLIDGKRMGKSLKNFYTLSDITEKGIDPLAFRLLTLQAHYRSQLNFSWDSLLAAQTNLFNLYNWADQQFQQTVKQISNEEITEFKNRVNKFLEADLNSPGAIAAINELTSKGAPDSELLEYLDKLFGLGLSSRKDIDADQKTLIANREKARTESDWQKSDQLRSQLKKQGLEINDSDTGPIWHRTN